MNGSHISQSETWRSLPSDLETIAIKLSRSPESFASKCLTVPIFSSALHAIDEPSYEECMIPGKKVFFHGRKGNPTRDILENLLAKIEDSKYALTFSSGAAAINCVLQSLLSQGAHAVATETIYGGTVSILKDFSRFGVTVDFDNTFDTEKICSLVKKTTKLLWLESPANPTMKLVDIQETVKAAKKKNPEIIVVVDNTFLTPVFQRPLELGADISVYSCSKYLNGHADMFMGSIACNDEALFETFRMGQEVYGAIPSPFDCYNLIRSLKTLPIRMQQHSRNGEQVAAFLEGHPSIEEVIYPGLKSHPHYQIALKQQYGNSGGIGFYLKGGLGESYRFLKALRVVLSAPSIGTDMSIANLPCKLSHGEMSKEDKDRLGITDNFIRLSVGLENAQTIIADLDQALKCAMTTK